MDPNPNPNLLFLHLILMIHHHSTQTNNGNGSGRRVLSYPAIAPCDSISPATLLHSLINLAAAISANYKSTTTFFSTNRRNAAIAFRHVSNLLNVFEDIRDVDADLDILPNDAAVLSLSELHLAFQKLLALLHDCTHPDARIWMLLNSHHASNTFWLSIRAISTALDVFPLKSSVHIAGDTREVLDMVMRHTWISTFRPDPEDLLVSDIVLMRILALFEHGVDPNPEDVALVMTHLGITRWSDCHMEVKFLESEIQLDFLNPERKKELELLSSLAGFMMYCRGVLFDTVDPQGISQRFDASCTHEITELKGINLDDLRCPISLEIMSDPVTLSTGQTYDRSSITKWFGSGNVTCPNTGERLATTELVPNLAIKGIIFNRCLPGNGVVAAEPSRKSRHDATSRMQHVPGSLAAEGAMKLLARFLVNKLVAADKESSSKVAFEIRVLTKTSIFNRSCLVTAGAIPHLLALLSSQDSTTQENAIAPLLNLSKHPNSRAMMVENRGLKSILIVLKEGLKDEAKQHAAGVIFYIASMDEYRATVGQNPVTIPALVDLIKNGNERCKRNALVAIFGLLQDPENQYLVLASGIVPLLLDLLKDHSERQELVTDCLAVLTALADRVDGTVAILRRRGFLEAILKTMESSSSTRAVKECCVSVLLALCVNGGGDVLCRLVKSHTLMASLYCLVGSEGGRSRGCKRASAVIRMLQEFYEMRSSSSAAPVARPALSRERFVHVW